MFHWLVMGSVREILNPVDGKVYSCIQYSKYLSIGRWYSLGQRNLTPLRASDNVTYEMGKVSFPTNY